MGILLGFIQSILTIAELYENTLAVAQSHKQCVGLFKKALFVWPAACGL